MQRHGKGACFLLACFAVGLWGCERVALLPRQDVDRQVANRDSIERRDDIRGRDYHHDEVVGTVQRVDENDRTIHLLTTDGRKIVLKYDNNTEIYRRDRASVIHSLRHGDLVLIRMVTDSRGERYADLIRADERPEFGSRR